MWMGWAIGLGILGILALATLYALGQRKKLKRIYEKWRKELNEKATLNAKTQEEVEEERKQIKKELKSETKENVVKLFFNTFKHSPME